MFYHMTRTLKVNIREWESRSTRSNREGARRPCCSTELEMAVST